VAEQRGSGQYVGNRMCGGPNADYFGCLSDAGVEKECVDVINGHLNATSKDAVNKGN